MKLTAILFFIIALYIGSAGAQIIHTIAGNGVGGHSGDGIAATAAELDGPMGIAFDKKGNLYISENVGARIRKVDAGGIISTIAGTGLGGFSGDNSAATNAQIRLPSGIAADSTGNLYFCDSYNNRVRKIDTNGYISTIAGTGLNGWTGDNGPATNATLWDPFGVSIDKQGNIYIADCGNHAIRKINTAGIITTIAGTGVAGFSGDNSVATAAMLKYPRSAVCDNNGNIYIADCVNRRVRKIDNNGIITTIAGNGTTGYSGDGAPATLAQMAAPYCILVDDHMNIIIADAGVSSTIRLINTAGIITTIAGTGYSTYNGDGLPATQTNLGSPSSISFGKDGSLYFVDSYHFRVRYMRSNLETNNLIKNSANLILYPNPSNGIFFLEGFDRVNDSLKITEIDNIGRHTNLTYKRNGNLIEVNLNKPPGLYYLLISDGVNTRLQTVSIY